MPDAREAKGGDRERVAEELRRIRESVQERAPVTPGPSLPEPAPVRAPEAVPPVPPLPARSEPSRPDGSAVNALWPARPTRQPGRLGRLLRRLLAPAFDAQVAFNSRQVQLDNELLAYIDARFGATHRHYDEVLGIHGRHMADIDERHLILQEELVAHVHDLVRRIDLVLAEAERGRMSLELSLRDLQARLIQIEERLKGG